MLTQLFYEMAGNELQEAMGPTHYIEMGNNGVGQPFGPQAAIETPEAEVPGRDNAANLDR